MTDTLKPAELDLEALKPCPFCGAAHAAVQHDGYDTGGEILFVDCDSVDCDARGPRRYSRAQAIAAWNRRAPDPRIEALEAEVRGLEVSVLDAAISDRLDEAGSPLTWQEVALSAEAQRDRMREALELARGRIAMLMPADLPESDHPGATQYVLSKVSAALSQGTAGSSGAGE